MSALSQPSSPRLNRGQRTSFPALGRPPRRVLRLYLLVSTPTGRSTVLRTSPIDAYVEPPHVDFQWGQRPTGDAGDEQCRKALPATSRVRRRGKTTNSVVYEFSGEESNAIWAEAQPVNLDMNASPEPPKKTRVRVMSEPVGYAEAALMTRTVAGIDKMTGENERGRRH